MKSVGDSLNKILIMVTSVLLLHPPLLPAIISATEVLVVLTAMHHLLESGLDQIVSRSRTFVRSVDLVEIKGYIILFCRRHYVVILSYGCLAAIGFSSSRG